MTITSICVLILQITLIENNRDKTICIKMSQTQHAPSPPPHTFRKTENETLICDGSREIYSLILSKYEA